MADHHDIFLLDGLRSRILPAFDPAAIARSLTPLLDRSDMAGATAMWRETEARALRVLDRKKIPLAHQRMFLRDLCNAVKMELFVQRGTATCGKRPKPVPKKDPATAEVLAFRPRVAGGRR